MYYKPYWTDQYGFQHKKTGEWPKKTVRKGKARRVRRESDGSWAANVWVPGTQRRYHYRTRRDAQEASISDENVLYTSPYLR
jgi:hypothetical protein